MQGFAVVFFAIYSMARDPGTTIRLTLLPWAVAVIATVVLLELPSWLGIPGISAVRLVSLAVQGGHVAALVLLLLAVFMVGAWVGHSWHRHILLKEPASTDNPWRLRGSGSYYTAAIRFALVASAIIVMILLLMVPLVPELGLGGPGGKIVSIGINALLVTLVLRHGLILPAAAIGRPMTMEDSWRATRGYSGPIYAVALCVVLCIDLACQLPGGNLAALTLRAMAGWAAVILTVGALTVLYGVRIQGRRMII